jgi:autotransporter-associated beta strand protein
MDGNGDVVSVNKVGSGKLTLNGANGFTGDLTVSTGTLAGSGSIGGNLILQSGASLAPGSSIGTFTVGGNATLAGAVVLEIDQTSRPSRSDLVSVSGTITASGTLVVTNVGPQLINGTTFVLFNKGVTGFTSVTLPSSYAWIDNLASNGTITLQSGGLTNRPTMTSVFSAGTLTLNWPTSYIGYLLQSNSVSLIDTGAWYTVPGSISVNQMIMSVDNTKTNVFFRLRD